MRVAIPVYDGKISPVFGAERHLLVMEMLNGEVVKVCDTRKARRGLYKENRI